MSIHAIVHRFRYLLLNGIFNVFPPETEYYFYIFVKVNRIPGYLSFIEISK
jgi:hypothetical protein